MRVKLDDDEACMVLDGLALLREQYERDDLSLEDGEKLEYEVIKKLQGRMARRIDPPLTDLYA